MSTQAQPRSPEVDELSCYISETQKSQQAAGVEELVVGVDDPLEMSVTQQGDIVLETQQDSHSSDEDIADTQDTQVAEERAAKRSKKPAVLFPAE